MMKSGLTSLRPQKGPVTLPGNLQSPYPSSNHSSSSHSPHPVPSSLGVPTKPTSATTRDGDIRCRSTAFPRTSRNSLNCNHPASIHQVSIHQASIHQASTHQVSIHPPSIHPDRRTCRWSAAARPARQFTIVVVRSSSRRSRLYFLHVLVPMRLTSECLLSCTSQVCT